MRRHEQPARGSVQGTSAGTARKTTVAAVLVLIVMVLLEGPGEGLAGYCQVRLAELLSALKFATGTSAKLV